MYLFAACAHCKQKDKTVLLMYYLHDCTSAVGITQFNLHCLINKKYFFPTAFQSLDFFNKLKLDQFCSSSENYFFKFKFKFAALFKTVSDD